MNRHRVVLAAAILLVAVASFAPFIPAGNEHGESTPDVSPSFVVEGLEGLDRKIDLNFRESRLQDVFDVLGRSAGFVVDIPPNIRNERISLRVDDVTVGQALTLIAQRAGVAYSVPRSGHLRVDKSPLLAGVGDVTSPTLIPESKVEPVFPDSMRDAGIEGHVILQAVIDETGSVGELSVLKADPKDHPEMVTSAIEAVKQWRFAPATHDDGRPVAVYFTIFVQYSLHED